MAKINVTFRTRRTLKSRLTLWGYMLLAILGFRIDVDRAAKSVINKMRIEIE